jgi:type I restriction enzyme S subunit
MPFDAASVPLREMCIRITKGTTPTKGEGFVPRGINYIKSECITSDGAIDESKFTFIDEKTHKKLARSQLRVGNVLFSMAGVYLGKTAVVLPKHLPANTNQAVGIITLDESKADSRFIHYTLQSPACRAWVMRSAAQSAQPNFNLQEIGSLPIPALSLAEQRAIAETLGVLDDRIDNLRETNATLEAIAQARFTWGLVVFAPVRATADGRDPVGVPPEVADLFPSEFVDSEVGEIPKGWRWSKLDDISEVGIGKTPPRKEPHWFSEDSNDVRWVSIRDMGEAGTFISSTSEYLTEAAIGRFNVRRVPAHTVLLSFKLTVGRVAITDGEMTTNEAIAHFKLGHDSPLSSEFIYLYLKQFQYSNLSSTSSIADAVNSKTVKAIPILVPDGATANAFQEHVKGIFQRIKANQEEMRTLTELRDTLLPRLMSGKLRIPESQETVEEGAP